MSAATGTVADLPLDHLLHLGDHRGVFEHARGAVPRREHGYCLDDVARALGVLIRREDAAERPVSLTETSLRFVEAAYGESGLAHNRMDVHGEWTDEPSMGDWWGRGVGALGTVAAHAPTSFMRARGMRAFLVATRQRPVEVRTAVFAIPGIAEVVRLRPDSAVLRGLLWSAVDVLPTGGDADWDWLEPRLRYANAALPFALLAAGDVLEDPVLVERGLRALDVLERIESRDGHLSVTGPAGRSPDEMDAQFDQQPIEVAAFAEAAERAFDLTGDERWRATVRRALAWFLGDNDSGEVMIDETSGAGYDGLEPAGRNSNRGAESTLAALGTFQSARRLGIDGGRG